MINVFFLTHSRLVRVLVSMFAFGAMGAVSPVTADWDLDAAIPPSELSSHINNRSSQSYQLADVSAFTIGDEPRFAVIWEKRWRPKYYYFYGQSLTLLNERHEDLEFGGYRPIVIERYIEEGLSRFLGVWEQWKGPPVEFEIDLPWEAFEQELVQRAGQGQRLLRASVSPGPSGPLVTALWEERDAPDWKVRLDVSAVELDSVVADEAKESFRPARVFGYVRNGEELAMLLFEKKQGTPFRMRIGMSEAELEVETQAQTEAGFRPLSLSGYELNDGARYSAIWIQHRHPEPLSDYPVTGVPQPEFEEIDSLVLTFMAERGIAAGALCIAKDGVIVHERGFGWQDFTLERALRRSALFRLASLSKPLTRAAIQKLAAEGHLDLSDSVFDLGQESGGILNLEPEGSPDPRLGDITVQHLIDHVGGWWSMAGFDPLFQTYRVAADMGSPAFVPSREEIVRWMMGNALDYTPGTTIRYSNFGYMLLGLIIEEITGLTASEWIDDEMLRPLGIPEGEFQRGRSLSRDRNPREPAYLAPHYLAANLFYPSEGVPWSDGGILIETLDSAAGWISTSRAYLIFLQHYSITGFPRTGETLDLVYHGSLSGTSTTARQLPDGISYVLFFNQREPPGGSSYSTIRHSLDFALTRLTTWPESDPHAAPPYIPRLSLHGTTLQWPKEPGRVYQVEKSANLEEWFPLGAPLSGSNDETHFDLDISQLIQNEDRLFFRLNIE